ncbi:MAG: phosphatase PAP2 family protein [Anaerolineae bacterium]|nr:phosphatase PAP2 family protein [Anaerolineae bacterium]
MTVRQITRYRPNLTAVIVLCLLFFAALAYAVGQNTPMVDLDQQIADALYTRATPPVTQFFYRVALLGSEILAGLAIGLAGFAALRRRWTYVMLVLVAWLGGYLMNTILKTIFARERPIFLEPLAVSTNYSFPSGHAMAAVACYGLLGYFLYQQARNRWLRIGIFMVTLLLISLIGFSRIYLGVHFFSDVLAGFAAGALWMIFCLFLFRRLHPNR